MDDASRQLAPHTKHLGGIIEKHGAAIAERLSELTQSSDLGRPDTADDFKFLTVRKTIPAGQYTFDNLVGGLDDGGPTLGEVWLVQAIALNGLPGKSPAFALRTNTGRLIYGAKPEENNVDTFSGSIVLLQGEILEMEVPLEGAFDFSLTVIQRKFPRQEPDAGWGVSEEQYEEIPRSIQHEQERSFPSQGYVPGDQRDLSTGGDISPDVI
jgi:hypothetical protein